jgi:hypothetical protein
VPQCFRECCTCPAAHPTLPQRAEPPRPPSLPPSGMDFYVVLERPGFRVTRRRRCKTRVGVQHKVTKEDAIKW